MARPPLTRIDGEPAQGVAAPSPPPAPPSHRFTPPKWLTARVPTTGASAIPPLIRRAPAPQVWLGGGCVLGLLALLASGGGRDETRRSSLDRAANDPRGLVVATLRLPGSDARPLRRICDDEGLPAELCARSVACAPATPLTGASAPRVVRLFLRPPAHGGCP